MKLPIPTHLQQYFITSERGNDEYKVTGTIRCACGGENFEIWESNERHIIQLICKNCKREILLFDAGKHGWDGYVCHEDYCDRTQPMAKYICSKCGQDGVRPTVAISSQGKEDFIEFCESEDDSFSPDEWVNAFEWITVSLSCRKCGRAKRKWADIETM